MLVTKGFQQVKPDGMNLGQMMPAVPDFYEDIVDAVFDKSRIRVQARSVPVEVMGVVVV